MGANTSLPSSDKSSQSSRGSTILRYSQVFGSGEVENVVREKKKKSSKLATLRKKLIRSRRHSRSLDHARAIRDLTSTWTIRELNALVEEYQASLALKELALHANMSRPHGNSFKEDLSALYDYKYCTDVDLIYRGACFPAHRVILSIRCSFFKDVLAKYPGYGAQVPVQIRTKGVDINMFSALLRYLYTGDFSSEGTRLDNLDLIVQLCDEFGTPNALEQDLRTLLETGIHSDAALVFTSDTDCHDPLSTEAGASAQAGKHELRCHKAILAARSPFFRNLLLRRARSGEELTELALQSPTCIILDETVIPKQYARVLLHAIYLDSVDLSCIMHSSVSTCSLSEVQAMVSGKGHMTQTDEAMEIYQIGQFLDFPILSQGCEDLIVESITVETLLAILHWSSEPHGSQWVHRQALHFLKEEFIQIAHSPLLCEMTKEYLIEGVKSDFLQASELDVLTAVLKWGEHQLIKRMEEREPNLLSHTAHSVSKKGIKKRDLNDVELRDILAEVLPHVRMDHVIPPNSDMLNNAIKRGLVSTPPSHMIGDEGSHSRISAWVRGKNNGMFVKPRLFTPYYEETKSSLEEQVSQVQENEVVRLRMVHMSAIPDTLYMVEDKPCSPMFSPHLPSSSSTVDIIAGTIPVPDPETLKTMMRREHELQHTKLAQRAYALHCSDRRAISHEIQLRVVREFGLPDTTVEVLQSSHLYHMDEQVMEARYCTPTRTPTRDKHTPSTPVSPARSYSPVEKEPSTCSDSVLSDMMPDIAMATSSMNQMSLQEYEGPPPDLGLDLGDGSSPHGTLYI